VGAILRRLTTSGLPGCLDYLNLHNVIADPPTHHSPQDLLD
jgi:hypothetical protein